MLIGISPLLSPELLDVLYRMGHGDEIVLGDAHFPGESVGKRVVRADGLKIPPLLDAILPLFKLDGFVDAPLIMMAPVSGDTADPDVLRDYRAAVDRHWPETHPIKQIDRFDFYARSESAFAVVMTGELAKYGNIILKKGVTPV